MCFLLLRVELLVTELETSLGNILERNIPEILINTWISAQQYRRYSLPLLEMTEKDFIQRLCKEEDFITTGMELFDEDALSKVLRLLANLSEVEDLLLALLLVLEVLSLQ